VRNVLREEKKYLIGAHEYAAKRHLLSALLTADRHGIHGGYPVRSLYFDTPYDVDFYEKKDGVELRRKIRLRIYDPHGDFAMLEMKQKQGQAQRKRSLRLRRDDAEQIIAGDLSPLTKSDDPFAAELYGFMLARCYRPKTIVEYDREAFIIPGSDTRITFDRNIRATESSFDLFSDKLNLNPVMDPYCVVMEVKYNGFLLSYIRDLLGSIDKSELSVSKYVLARQQSYLTHL